MSPPAIHIAGIGGVGMSALAQALLDEGAAVSGSDRLLDRGDLTETLRLLRAQGVVLHPQDGGGLRRDTPRLVVSSAIERDNPDLLAARRLGVPVAHRAAELARLVAARRLVAVTGTCGKSSVTAMLGWLLAGAGFDPLVVNGAAVVGWEAGGRIGSVRRGRGAWAVIEADESDRSLLTFAPDHAIVTNMSADHFDLAATQALFDDFRGRVRGELVEGEPPAEAILPLRGWQGGFVHDGVSFTVPLPGRHNVANAWQAVRLARKLGIGSDQLARHLATFPGVERRLQRVGTCGGTVVVDDYAHNPVKLAAAWSTLADIFPRIAAVWRPHGYGPLRAMLAGLAESFGRVVRPRDRLWLLPVYDAGGTADRSIGSADLLALLQARGVPAASVAGLDEAESVLRAAAAPETALLVCGARDPGLPRLAARLCGAA